MTRCDQDLVLLWWLELIMQIPAYTPYLSFCEEILLFHAEVSYSSHFLSFTGLLHFVNNSANSKKLFKRYHFNPIQSF